MFRHSGAGSERFLPILTGFGGNPNDPIVPGALPFTSCLKSGESLNFARVGLVFHVVQGERGFWMSIETEIQFACKLVKLSKKMIQEVVARIAADYGWEEGEISIAVVDDAEIHRVNRDYLSHDYPTDVISFDTTESDDLLEGEVIASAQTAARVASENGWKSEDELLLYIIHGMLHVIGLDDTTAIQSKKMREAERYYVQEFLGDTAVCNEAR